jgi:hypothetical protein
MVRICAHTKTGVGISFQLSRSATGLSGFPESTNLLNLPDVDSERCYTLHFYPLAGYVPFVVAHNLDHECAPAVFWMNPSDTFYRLKTSATTRNLFILSETGCIDFILFLAPFAESLPQYFHLAGFPFLPPAFSLGYHQCRYGYPNQAHVEEVMANLSGILFPQDAQWLDLDNLENNKSFTLSSTWWTNATKLLRMPHLPDVLLFESLILICIEMMLTQTRTSHSEKRATADTLDFTMVRSLLQSARPGHVPWDGQTFCERKLVIGGGHFTNATNFQKMYTPGIARIMSR